MQLPLDTPPSAPQTHNTAPRIIVYRRNGTFKSSSSAAKAERPLICLLASKPNTLVISTLVRILCYCLFHSETRRIHDRDPVNTFPFRIVIPNPLPIVIISSAHATVWRHYPTSLLFHPKSSLSSTSRCYISIVLSRSHHLLSTPQARFLPAVNHHNPLPTHISVISSKASFPAPIGFVAMVVPPQLLLVLGVGKIFQP